jgi:hypothetical protein
MNGKRRSLILILLALLLLGVFHSTRATANHARGSPAVIHLLLQQAATAPAATAPHDQATVTHRKTAATIRQNRAAWEERMLASAVRLELRVFSVGDDGRLLESLQSSTGHATVKDGRYLVTHNHYGVSVNSEQVGTTTRVTVFKADGQEVILHEPLSAVQVAFEDPETLVLDFGVCSGQGVFAQRGVVSADFRDWQSLALQPGMQVAQLDWDGDTAHIDWVEIEEIVSKNGVCTLRLDNFIKTGASGGPIFFDGYHIANNWSRATVRDRNEQIIDQHSFAALNSPQVAAYIAY